MSNIFGDRVNVYDLIGDAVDESIEATKTAAAQGRFGGVDGLTPNEEEVKVASAPATGGSFDVDYLTKVAMACGEAANILEKSAEGNDGPKAGGPADNENASAGFGTPNVDSESRKYRTGGGSVDGEGRLNDNENLNIPAETPGAGLGKAAQNMSREEAIAYIKGTQVTHPTSSPPADDQPSAGGPADNETGHAPSGVPGSWMVGGDPANAEDLDAETAEDHAKNNEFPLTEPQSHDTTRQSGSGTGPVSAGMKIASREQAISYIQGIIADGGVDEVKEAMGKNCAKCASHPCECDDDEKKEKKDEKKEKESMMDTGLPSVM